MYFFLRLKRNIIVRLWLQSDQSICGGGWVGSPLLPFPFIIPHTDHPGIPDPPPVLLWHFPKGREPQCNFFSLPHSFQIQTEAWTHCTQCFNFSHVCNPWGGDWDHLTWPSLVDSLPGYHISHPNPNMKEKPLCTAFCTWRWGCCPVYQAMVMPSPCV